VTTSTRRRPAAGGVTARGRSAIVWLVVAGLVWAASIVDILTSDLALVSTITSIGLTAVMMGCGSIIVLRTDVPLLGWLLVATGATINSFSAIEAVDLAARTDAQMVWVSIIGFSPTALLAAIVLFPSGRARSTVARLVLVGGVGVQVVSHSLQLGQALGLIGGDWTVYRGVGDTGVAATVMATLAFHVAVYRRRPRVEQLQVKYLMLVLLLAAITFLMGESGGALMVGDGVSPALQEFLDAVGPGLVPIAIMLAMTRYRLYEIDRIISRTVGYAGVVGTLAVLFVVGVAAVSTLLPTNDGFAVAITTIGVVALFDPLRRRLVAAVDRRFDRTRYEARRVVEQFGRSIQVETNLDAVRARLLDVIRRTTAPSTVAVWEPARTRTDHR
jgi:hypothetical protein